MKTDLTARATAFCLSAFLTLAMLGGVDLLATSEPSDALMARVAPATAPVQAAVPAASSTLAAADASGRRL